MSHLETDLSHDIGAPSDRPPRGLTVSVADVSEEPIKHSEVADWLRIDVGAVQASLINTLISAVRKRVEDITRRLMARREVTATWETFYAVAKLPFPPLGSISSVETYDRDTDSWDTVSSSDYDLVERELTLDDGQGGDWVRVTYDAGYQDLPADLKIEMLRDIRYAYDHRDPGADDAGRLRDPMIYRTYRPY